MSDHHLIITIIALSRTHTSMGGVHSHSTPAYEQPATEVEVDRKLLQWYWGEHERTRSREQTLELLLRVRHELALEPCVSVDECREAIAAHSNQSVSASSWALITAELLRAHTSLSSSMQLAAHEAGFERAMRRTIASGSRSLTVRLSNYHSILYDLLEEYRVSLLTSVDLSNSYLMAEDHERLAEVLPLEVPLPPSSSSSSSSSSSHQSYLSILDIDTDVKAVAFAQPVELPDLERVLEQDTVAAAGAAMPEPRARVASRRHVRAGRHSGVRHTDRAPH